MSLSGKFSLKPLHQKGSQVSKELQDGVEVFEGKEVSNYKGKLAGSFDIDQAQGVAMTTDGLVAFIGTARVGGAKFSVSKTTGLQSRENTLNIEDLTILDPEKAVWLFDQLGKVVAGINDLVEPEKNEDAEVEEDDDDQLSIFSMLGIEPDPEAEPPQGPFMQVHYGAAQ